MNVQNKVPSNSEQHSTRLRVSFGGLLIPIAIVIAIGALETARTEGAHREVFFNIRGFVIMYFIFGVAVAAIAIAFNGVGTSIADIEIPGKVAD